MVNEFIGAIEEKDLEKGIKAVQKAAEENLDMKLYFKLIIEKFRLAIILRYAPKLKDEMIGDASEADVEFLQGLIKEDPERKPTASNGAGKEGHLFTSSTLSVLLESYQNMDNAFISELSGGFFQVLAVAFGSIFNVVLIVLISFYLSIQEKGIENFLRIIIPIEYEEYAVDLWSRSRRKIALWMKGQMLLGLLIAILTYLILSILCIQYPLVAALFYNHINITAHHDIFALTI